ncbi:hypothetical protein C8F04DRAFT_1262062 [Mycena alexandri]|uniref:Uncharacterized protein n=1 Tax=Mycena alexandri TaxID=1745969 RepID=A0AAD6X2D6_9AGAR|nr:hypothetical protein C8F04DRAFT_1262062 [Mycena alexandri]
MAKGNGAPKRRPAAAKPKPKQVAKKTQESDGEYEESASVPAKRGRKPVDPRSPLPDRKHRNTHPGELPGVQASKKWTHEQVVEAESCEEARRRRLAELEVQKIAILAEMELEAEQDAVRESNSVVKNLDDHNTDFDAASDVESPRYIPPDEFTGQAAMSDDDDMGSGGPYLDDLPQHSSPDHRMDAVVRAQLQEESQRIMVMLNSQTAQQAVIPVARLRGQKKGAIRMAVDATKAQIKEGKQSGGDSIQATDPKKLKPLFQFPAGLKNNWQKSADK